MKRGTTKLILASISLVISLFFVVGTTIAWFVTKSAINDMGFQVLQIDSQVNVYQGLDVNHNGVIDLLDDENINKYRDNTNDEETYASYSRLYYDEIHEFLLLDSKYALSLQSSANQINTIKLDSIAPGKIFTYKFEITNYSSYTNFLSFSFINSTLSENELKTLSLFDVRLGEVLDNGKVNYVFDWGKIVTENENDYSYTGMSLVDGMEVTPRGKGNKDGRKDIWIQFKMRNDVSFGEVKLSSITFPDFNLELTALVDESEMNE